MIEQISLRVLPDGRVNRRHAATFLGVSVKTLADWAYRGLGPMPRKVGGHVFYYLRDLEAFRDNGSRVAA